ncbi:MAG: argininosuccinate lyase [Thaumarchaeota archaeon]|nr:argininosuccinate lyase [Nitrososphaerota archaeon]
MAITMEGEDANLTEEKDILHSSRLGSFSQKAADYTNSIDLDPKLVDSVIAINKAHAIMLSERKIISKEVAIEILRALDDLPKNFVMKPDLEDVHMNVEDQVITRAGKDAGGMLNLAKSRNDQVATAIRMALRDQLILLGKSIIELQKSFLAQAKKHSDSLIPGYTHLQRGQPVTLGHYLLAHFDSLDRDFSRLVDCYLRTNLSPLGAGALASTGFNIDRERTAELLGFDSLVENSLDAVSSRDFATEAIFLCSQTMTDLSSLAEEIILWTTTEFSFATISDEFASTSSMMPQKKNAIVPEIIRAITSQVVGDLTAALSLLKALPLSYNLDLQELTRNLWSAMEKTITSVSILAPLIGDMSFNADIMSEAIRRDEFVFSTELADYLVSKFHVPFREAHGRVGKLVRELSSARKSGGGQFSDLSAETLVKYLGVDISPDEIKSIVDPKRVLERRKALGSPNPKLVLEAIAKRMKTVAKHEETIGAFGQKISESNKNLVLAADAIEKTGKSVKGSRR